MRSQRVEEHREQQVASIVIESKRSLGSREKLEEQGKRARRPHVGGWSPEGQAERPFVFQLGREWPLWSVEELRVEQTPF